MAQHDYNIANQSGADFRADLNNALLAIATVNSGATEPSTTFAHQLWVDTSSSVLKIRNAADNAWITTGVSITASNTFTGDLTGDVTGNLTGNVTGNVTGDLTGNADSADTLSTARTISLSGDVVGSASFDGSANIDIDTVVQINSITLGTDTTGDYVESMSGGTGVTVTGGTGEGSTPSIAIGQAVATTDNVTFNLVTATDEFVGDLDGAVRFSAKAGEALTKGDLVYVSGVSGDVPVVSKAKADDVSKMPVFGLAVTDANNNAGLQVATFGTLDGLDTSGVSEGQILYASTTAGAYTTTKPTGESSQIQNIGKVIRSHAAAGSIKIGGAGRSNDVPNLNNGKIFIGNASNQAITSTLDTSIVIENTNLYYTTARANTDFDTRLATKDTGDLTEGSNLYYTTARVNSDFDTRLATKDTGDLAEGSNLYYTDARVNSAFDTRLATKDTDDLTEGTTNLYYTSGRANSDFDTRLATKSTTDLAEGTNLYYTSARFDSAFTSKDTDDLSEGTTNLYYTTARFDSAFGNKTTTDLTEGTNLYYTDTRANSAIDTRVTKAFVDALGIQASSVDANSVTLGTDTVGNYVATVTGTANKITVTGSGSESANITLSLPDDVQIASDLTVAGNLTVNGTLTSLDTTNLDIEDNLFQLNAGLTGSPVNDSGMLINRGDQDNGIFMWDESVDKFTMGLTTADGSATGNITLNSLGTLVANLEGNVTGAVTGTVSSLSNHDTDDLTEGSNLYYTQARFDSAFTAKSTSDLSEGSNLYYTDARFDTRLATKDTDDVSEGTSNLYYTTARFDSAFGGKSTSDLSEGTNLYYTDARVQAVSINNVVEDTTPQLGGNLDLNSSDITGTGDINVTGTVTADGLTVDGSADGSIINITKNGSDVGNIGVDNSDNLVIEGNSSHSGLQFSTNSILPHKNGAVVDATISLGNASTRFTNLHLSGTATMDGLLVEGETAGQGASIEVHATASEFGDALLIAKSDNANTFIHAGVKIHGSGNPFYIYQSNGSATNTLRFNYNGFSDTGGQMTIGSNGDISFYEDTGTTAKFFWDASAESLGIGETSPSASYSIDATKGIRSSAAAPNFTLQETDTGNQTWLMASYGGTFAVRDTTVAGSSYPLQIQAATPNNTLFLKSDGNVGIGTSSPDTKLHVHATGGSEPLGLFQTTSTGDCAVRIEGIGGEAYLEIANTSASTGNTSNSWGIGCNDDTNLHIAYGTNGTMNKNSNVPYVFVNSSSGNVGIGTTSPAQALVVNRSSGNTYLEISRATQSQGQVALQLTGGTGGTNWIMYQDTSSNDLRFFGNSATRMTIDSSGNVGIGTSSPNFKLHLKDGTSTAVYQQFTNDTTGNTSGDGTVLGIDADGDFLINNLESKTIKLFTADEERMRIDSSGNLLWANTGGVSSSQSGIVFNNTTHPYIQVSGGADTSFRYRMEFINGNGIVGTITTNGSATAYNTSSDYRLKENVDYDFNALDRVAQLKPARFNFISDETNTLVDGFLAHEVQDIVPEAITGTKDAVREEEYEITPAVLDDDGNVVTEAEMGTREVPEYQGIDQSKLVPLLTKAIQEQQELINNLTARIEQLEN
jgi:hypothetical protein